MDRNRRLRRALILCSNTARNIAFYRAGWNGKQPLFGGEFGKSVNSNFFDVCILEWCKLFADERDQHNWKKVVSNPTAFERALLHHIRCSSDDFVNCIKKVRTYRDKFIAHLDSEPTMHLPHLDILDSSVHFYYLHIVENEAGGKITDAPDSLDVRCALWSREAANHYATWNALPKTV